MTSAPEIADKVGEAWEFCLTKHRDQKRKYTGIPYSQHCENVKDILTEFGITNSDMLCAAYLHDVIEDTNTEFKEIYDKFGYQTGDLVFWLTDISRPEMGNRELRKHLDRLHLWAAPYEAQIIKCADCIDNARDIQFNDPDFAVVYNREMRTLLRGMSTHTQLSDIWNEAYRVVG